MKTGQKEKSFHFTGNWKFQVVLKLKKLPEKP